MPPTSSGLDRRRPLAHPPSRGRRHQSLQKTLAGVDRAENTKTAARQMAPPRWRAEDGSITPFFVVMAIALLIGIGISVDGSGVTRADGRADDVAAEAARRGAQQIVEGSAVLGTGLRVDPVAAEATAEDYIASAGMSGSARVEGNLLEVDITTVYVPVFLDLVPGAGPVTVNGHAEAELVPGLDGALS
jgi:Flp pilus assembly protein TadG